MADSPASKPRPDRRQQLQAAAGLVVLLVAIAAGYHWLNRPQLRSGHDGPLGTSCQRVPSFAKSSGISAPVFDTSRRGVPGLVMYDANDKNKALQAPSWKEAGNLGPIASGDNGDLYVAPVPNINTLANPPDKQNTVYLLNPDDGILDPYTSLQGLAKPDQSNPYGLLSLAYDCESKVLYASSISGSRQNTPSGAIVALDTGNSSGQGPQEISRLKGYDVLSLGLFRDKRGAELYFGLANKSEVWRVGIGDDGSIQGKPQKLFDFDDYNELKPRKLIFNDANNLEIHTTEFRYNLVASTEFRQATIKYRYDKASDSWHRQ